MRSLRHRAGGILDIGNWRLDIGPLCLFFHLRQVRIVRVAEDDAVVLHEPVVELRLGAHHAFERTETFEVGTPHIGDESEVRFGYLLELFDIARMAGAHLYNRHLVRARHT